MDIKARIQSDILELAVRIDGDPIRDCQTWAQMGATAARLGFNPTWTNLTGSPTRVGTVTAIYRKE